MLAILLILLAISGVAYAIAITRAALAEGKLRPSLEAIGVGGVVNFFDTLGIGSFAPTLTWLKFRTQVSVRQMPSTLIVACTIPTILQSGIFLALLGVHVDPVLMGGYAVTLLLGGLIGARLVSRVPIWLVQAVVAGALLIAATLFAASNLHLMPPGGTASALPLPLMLTAIAASFVMGLLLNFGVGHYAPSLVMLSLMGMDPRLAFPIMATGGAVTATVISARHLRAKVADLPISIGFMLGGVPGVLLAAFAVKDMPVAVLRWLVIVVVVYAAGVMIRDAIRTFRHLSPDDLALAAAEGLVD